MVDKRAVLIVLDGWGINMSNEGNAIASAHTPVYASLMQDYPHTSLEASGEAVGLPDGCKGFVCIPVENHGGDNELIR